MGQMQEDKEFRGAFSEKNPEEKQASVLQHREAQIAENKAFQQAAYDKQMAELKAKLAQNTKLTEAQKNEILAAREKQYVKTKAYGDQRRGENNVFFQKLAEDSKMTEEQKREAIQEHFRSQKPADQVFREQQKAESKSEREKIRSEVSSSANTVKS